MPARKFPVPKLLVEVATRKLRLLQSLAQEVDGHFCRWLAPSKQRHEEFLVRLDSRDMDYECHLDSRNYGKSHLIVGNIIVCTHSLNLHRAEHPADIIDDLNIGGSGLKCDLTR